MVVNCAQPCVAFTSSRAQPCVAEESSRAQPYTHGYNHVSVQGPVKKQQPDGMSHGGPPPPSNASLHPPIPPPPSLKEMEGKGSEWRSASGRRQLQTRTQDHGFLPKPPPPAIHPPPHTPPLPPISLHSPGLGLWQYTGLEQRTRRRPAPAAHGRGSSRQPRRGGPEGAQRRGISGGGSLGGRCGGVVERD